MTVTWNNERAHKLDKNDNMTSEQFLVWARRDEAQKEQSAILENLNKTKDFDKIFARNRLQRQNKMQPWEKTRMPTRQRCKYCGFIHMLRKCLAYGKMCAVCGKINYYKELCRNGRSKMLHSISPQEHYDKANNDKMNSEYQFY